MDMELIFVISSRCQDIATTQRECECLICSLPSPRHRFWVALFSMSMRACFCNVWYSLRACQTRSVRCEARQTGVVNAKVPERIVDGFCIARTPTSPFIVYNITAALDLWAFVSKSALCDMHRAMHHQFLSSNINHRGVAYFFNEHNCRKVWMLRKGMRTVRVWRWLSCAGSSRERLQWDKSWSFPWRWQLLYFKIKMKS